MNSKHVRYVVFSGLIAAVYAALTYAGFGISYGPIQFRFAEALCILPILTPCAIPGLTIGCVIANIGSSYGIYDIIFGSLATLLAAIFARATRNVRMRGVPLLSPFGAVIFNAVIIGAVIAFTTGTPSLFFINAAQIFISQAVICYILGLPLYAALAGIDNKTHIFSK